ncbi:MAG: LytTR family transcriptional regulator DNA-binding domain-containing protein [Bacilli bacterium]
MVKPINPYDFYFQLNKITEYISKEASSFISIYSRTSLQKANINDIGYIQVPNHILVVKTLSSKIRFRGKIMTYEYLLYRNNFIRCDNSVLVNLRYCSKVNVFDSTIKIFGKEIQISCPRKSFLMLM